MYARRMQQDTKLIWHQETADLVSYMLKRMIKNKFALGAIHKAKSGFNTGNLRIFPIQNCVQKSGRGLKTESTPRTYFMDGASKKID